MSLYKVKSITGKDFDATIYSNGGRYHKVVISDVDTGAESERKFFSLDKAESFAKEQCAFKTTIDTNKATKALLKYRHARSAAEQAARDARILLVEITELDGSGSPADDEIKTRANSRVIEIDHYLRMIDERQINAVIERRKRVARDEKGQGR